jgi:hypothetical protein
VRANPGAKLSVEDAAMDLVCAQKQAPSAGAIKIGCTQGC